jgi:hypothetical protein
MPPPQRVRLGVSITLAVNAAAGGHCRDWPHLSDGSARLRSPCPSWVLKSAALKKAEHQTSQCLSTHYFLLRLNPLMYPDSEEARQLKSIGQRDVQSSAAWTKKAASCGRAESVMSLESGCHDRLVRDYYAGYRAERRP